MPGSVDRPGYGYGGPQLGGLLPIGGFNEGNLRGWRPVPSNSPADYNWPADFKGGRLDLHRSIQSEFGPKGNLVESMGRNSELAQKISNMQSRPLPPRTPVVPEPIAPEPVPPGAAVGGAVRAGGAIVLVAGMWWLSSMDAARVHDEMKEKLKPLETVKPKAQPDGLTDAELEWAKSTVEAKLAALYDKRPRRYTLDGKQYVPKELLRGSLGEHPETRRVIFYDPFDKFEPFKIGK